MLKYKICLVNFPYSEKHSQKIRPAVALTNQIGEFDHTIFTFISSKIPAKIESSDIFVSPKSSSNNLKKDSVIRLEKTFSIPTNSVFKVIGSLDEGDIRNLQSKIKELFL